MTPSRTASVASLHELLLHELGDLLDAEKQILKALPKMAKAASDRELKNGFEEHEKQTKEHVARLEKAFKLLEQTPHKVRCSAMEGLLKEGQETLNAKMPPAVHDAAMIGAAQRVEHYEMAAYGTARAYAELMGHNDVAELLQQTLEEESDTNQKLTSIAESVNPEANEENLEM